MSNINYNRIVLEEVVGGERPVVECPTEDTCLLTNKFLDSGVSLPAIKAFNISYENMDKDIFESKESYQEVYKLILKKSQEGGLGLVLPQGLPAIFGRHLESLGYMVSYSTRMYDGYSIRKPYYINWEGPV